MEEIHSLVHQLTEHLHVHHLTMATAESCTGGLIASLLTERPGSSAWFERGFVTYSNLAKQEMLGVDFGLIESQGAVSELVAEAMALGALCYSAAHFSLAVTGIAGPTGGSLSKPIGTVCFAWAMRGFSVRSERCCFQQASRQQVREQACHHALKGAIEFLLT